VLANISRPCLVVIDEKRGRRIAASVYGLPVKGTAGLFVEAHRRGLLDDVRETLLGLKRDGYFLADGVISSWIPLGQARSNTAFCKPVSGCA